MAILTADQLNTIAKQNNYTPTGGGFSNVGLPTTLNSANTSNNSAVTLPPAPTPAKYPDATGTMGANTTAMTTPSGATVDPKTGALVTPPPPTDTKSSLSSIPGYDAIKGYIDSVTGAKQPTVDEQYQKTYGITPEEARLKQEQAQNDKNIQDKATQDAQGEFDALNAQINGLDYQMNTVIPNQDQVNATGRGITTAGLATITADEQRKVLLQKAPLQYQALIAQAKLANAQGKSKLAEGILQQAQSHLDDIFKARVTDSQNEYNRQKDIIDKVYAFATQAVKDKLDQQKQQLSSNNTQYNQFVNDIRAEASSATTAKQGSLATKFSQLVTTLDPNSKTFAEDYKKAQETFATLKGQMQTKSTADTLSQFEQKNQAFNDINTLLTLKSSKGIPYTDSQGYFTIQGFKDIVQAASADGISRDEFIAQYGDRISPYNPKNYGLTPAELKKLGYE